jgi:D-alanine-D-alanine ligase-like ATP-grasp enzyme
VFLLIYTDNLCYNLVMEIKIQKRVGVLRGGTSGNYEASLREAGDLMIYIFENLSDKWKPIDIFIDCNEVWHIKGIPIKPIELQQKVDVVWDTTNSNASVILERLGVKRVGINSFSSLLQTHRPLLEEYLKNVGVNMPKSIILPSYQKDFDGPKEQYALKKAQEIFKKFTSPWIIRAYPVDVNTGVRVAKTFTELTNAIEDAMLYRPSILVEELIPGKTVSIHSLAGFRDKEIYSLPLISVTKGNVNLSEDFSEEEKVKFLNTVKDIYKHLGATYYLNSNFVLHPTRGIYLTSVCFSPNLRDSHFLYSCDSIGLKPYEVFDYILRRAL